jgi:transposase InsO family protein
VMVYIDDILIFSKTEEDHAAQVEWVLSQLQRNGYYANPDKCEFFQSEVNFLGHVIKAGGIAVQQHKVDSIAKWPVPHSVKDVRSFVGLATYYHRFVHNFASLCAPLTDLTRKDMPWKWSTVEQTAFDALKKALISAPMLHTPDNSKPYIVHTDASGYAVGATLSQYDEHGDLKPVAYMSKKMSPAQVNYAVHEWELLAVVEALKAWRCYLYGSSTPIEIYTDHHSLTYLSTQPNLSPRQSRWVEQLQDYVFKVHHLDGAKNVVADALSRRADYESAHRVEAEERLKRGVIDRPRLQLQVATVVSSTAIANVASSSIVSPSLIEEIKTLALQDLVYYQPLLSNAEHLGLLVKDGLVYSHSGLLYIPMGGTIRTSLLQEVHDAPSGGHLGRDKTYQRLSACVFWNGIYADVADYVKSCVSCGQNKARNRTAADVLRPLPIPSRRWETISMDFVGPLPKSPSGHDYLLVVVDKFSKMVHLIACHQSITTVQVAQLIYDNVVRLHGFPDNIVSDRDSKFTSLFWRSLWKLSGTQLKMSSSYHPQSDGQTENVNRVVSDILRAYVTEDRTDWDRHLTAVEVAINSSEHASTGFTPFFLNHNQEIRLPFHIAMKAAVESSTIPAAADMISAMAANDEIARARLADAQARQKAAADEYRRQATYVVNDQVMLATENLTAYQHKLCCRYLGPFAVLAVGNGTVTLDLPTELRRSYPTVNVDRVKPYTPSVGEWPGRQQHNRPLPVNAGADGAPEWEVEAVLGKKEEKEWRKDQAGNEIKKGGKVSVVRYLIAWLGYPASEWTWVRKDHLDGANDLIVDYERKSSPRPGRHQVMFCSTSSADE